MDVDLPFAARLGVETADSDKDKKVQPTKHTPHGSPELLEAVRRYKAGRARDQFLGAVSCGIVRHAGFSTLWSS